jgi:hypothetical protein
MVRRAQIVFAVTSLCVCWTPVAVLADPVTVQLHSGTIVVGHIDIAGAGLNIRGTDGFSFDAGADSALADAQACAPCFSGDRISLSAQIPGSFFGTATLHGRTYEFDISHGGGFFETVTASFVLPTSASGTVLFTTPFMLINSALGLPDADGAIVGGANLSGHGRATGTFRAFYDQAEGRTRFELLESGLRYDFEAGAAPVPEPSSMLLFASGAAFVARRLRRRVMR